MSVEDFSLWNMIITLILDFFQEYNYTEIGWFAGCYAVAMPAVIRWATQADLEGQGV